jgi:hypothetical protein
MAALFVGQVYSSAERKFITSSPYRREISFNLQMEHPFRRRRGPGFARDDRRSDVVLF